jgi:excisionase family DNA binding protein
MTTRRLLTTLEVAETLGVRPQTITSWVRQGRIPAIKIGRKTYRFDPNLIAHLTRQTTADRAAVAPHCPPWKAR